MTNLERIKKAALQTRRDVVEMTLRAGQAGGHIASALCCADILATLYFGVLRYKAEDPCWDQRDRFILSKGHAVMAQYSVLEQAGFLNPKDNTYGLDHTRYIGHSPKNFPGVEFPTGSMGHGPSLAAGMALSAKKDGNPAKVYVLCGDGEIAEGSVWEALLFASKYKLDNLTVIVDNNGIQHDAFVKDVLPSGDLAPKFKEFGFFTIEVDGNDPQALLDAFNADSCGMPKAIVAKTVKGKGVSFIENRIEWHHGRLTPELAKQALSELK